MRLTTTKPRTWVSVATLLTTMAFGCDGADSGTTALESEFVRKAAVGDAGDSTDDTDDQPDAAVASWDGGATAPVPDGGEPAVTDDETDASVQLTDNQIFGIVVANNDAELAAASTGEGKLRGAAAELAGVVTGSANAAASRHSLLASVTGLTAEDSEQSTERERIAGDTNTMLESEPASDSLDLRYAFVEAMTNQRLVQLIDDTLLPQADSELLKTELRTTRETAQRRVTEGGALVRALAPSVAPPADASTDDSDRSDPDAGEPDAPDADTTNS